VGVALHENVRSYCAPGGRRCDAVVDILDSCGQAVQSSTVDLFSTLLVPRPPTQGLYSLRLRIGGAVLEEPLYYGLAASELDVPALKLASEAWPDEETKAVASALTKRLDRLFGPVDLLERSHADWQRRVVWAIGQLESMACSVKTGDQPLREYSGTRLGAFRSAIDGQHQLYLLHLPAPRSGQSGHSGVPLVVNFPYRLYDGGKPVPFYFGMQFARLDDMEYRCKLADEHGFAYLSTQARGEESFAPMAAVDVMEAVADVEKKHVIDRSRVYLFGHCEGGSGSLLLASQYPGTFAAVSAVGAPTSEGSPPDRPIDLAANLNDTPALLIHSRFDAKVPVSELFSFQAAYASAGVNATVKVLERSDNEWTSEDPLRTIFDFFGKIGETQRPKRVRLVTGRLRYGSAHWLEVTRLTDYGHPGTVDAQDAGHGRILITSENVGQLAIKLDSLGYGEGCNTPVEIVLNGQAVSTGVRSGCRVVIEVDGEKAVHGAGTRKSALVEGPIGDLFARPFLVVTGSLGEPGGGGFNGDFVRTWEERYYGKCRQKSDTAITPEDISRYDVVLIGDGRVNSLSRQIEARLPFRMRNDGVEIAQERFKGDGLCMAALYPNPLNPAKYVLYMAGTQSALPHSWDPRWFGESGSDVLLWRSRGDGSIEVIKRLRWNEDWTRPVPVSEKGR
jgi:dienelactone hydrolase